ncbi:MAG: hypothetical protein QME51_02145 [Planctomycetota bacterium]|nr:hypothetical protein [Planctomycetota bacterium]MDI6787154.1 hypothetical protein [Planctomycetota bacterium]
MRRRFNYTDRQRIKHENVSAKINKTDYAVSFDATASLENMNLQQDASVYLEIYHGTVSRRYFLGTIRNNKRISDRDISDLGYVDYLMFRVRVVDESNKIGLILAAADKISPRDKEGKELKQRSILPVYWHKDLGQRIWQIEYSGDGPEIYFSKSVPGIKQMAKSDRFFFFTVYPAVIREILTYLFLVEEISNLDDLDEGWQKDWIDFARYFNPENIPDGPDDADYKEEITDWIDDVIDEFCKKHPDKWKEFISTMKEGEGV